MISTVISKGECLVEYNVQYMCYNKWRPNWNVCRVQNKTIVHCIGIVVHLIGKTEFLEEYNYTCTCTTETNRE